MFYVTDLMVCAVEDRSRGHSEKYQNLEGICPWGGDLKEIGFWSTEEKQGTGIMEGTSGDEEKKT